ncbi:MAG: hypothetical protein HUJ90_00600 [Bacteroidales bacterium]|nr:hypothetical protein [Bacteroidales bacterium]
MPDCGTVELIIKELEHAGFRNLVLVTDRGYESMKNLELYIARGQKVITSVKVSGGDVISRIRPIDMSRGFPQGMAIATEFNLFSQVAKDTLPAHADGYGRLVYDGSTCTPWRSCRRRRMR